MGPMTNETEKMCNQMKFSYYYVEAQIKNLTGKILTVVEASISDPEQRKALKDVMRNYLNSAIEEAYNDATVDKCSQSEK